MKREIKIVRCDCCGKRVHEWELAQITIKRPECNYSDLYDICKDCVSFFELEMKYKDRVKESFFNLSEEELIKDDPEELPERHNAQKNIIGKYRGRDVTCEPDGRVIFHFNDTTEADDFLNALEAKWRIEPFILQRKEKR